MYRLDLLYPSLKLILILVLVCKIGYVCVGTVDFICTKLKMDFGYVSLGDDNTNGISYVEYGNLYRI